MSTGDIIIAAVIEADAIQDAIPAESGGWIFVWNPNAEEQIEAALNEAGYTLCPNNEMRDGERKTTANTTSNL